MKKPSPNNLPPGSSKRRPNPPTEGRASQRRKPFYADFVPQRDEAPVAPRPPRPERKPRPAPAPETALPETAGDGLWRLNRYLAQAGVAARRAADKLIAEGRVSVNGKPVTELGTRIDPRADKVTLDGKPVRMQRLVYVLLNKPKNHLTTANDPEGRRTVMDIVAEATEERIYPVGRLDRNTTGVLLLTNDGELAKRLTHPSYGVRKVYSVRLNKPVAETDLQRLRDGITLDDGPIRADQVDYMDDAGPDEIGIELHSGRNRIVRRMFEHLGYEVINLDRVAFGPLTKKGLRRGYWRMLEAREIAFLKMMPKAPTTPGSTPATKRRTRHSDSE